MSGLFTALFGPRGHCWARWRKHRWMEHLGSERLYYYWRCADCGWPGGISRKWPGWDEEPEP